MHPFPLWVIRHGQTEWNLQHRWQGRLDSPLTARGEAQAQAVGAKLRDMGLADVPMLCSPQGRAVHTAALIAEALDRPAPPTDPRLSEIDVGTWSGLTKAEILDRHGPWSGLFPPYDAAPRGEGIAGLHRRVCALLADLTGPAILVTHGITSRVLRAAALGLPPEDAEALPGGQGVIHVLNAGQAETIDAVTGERRS